MAHENQPVKYFEKKKIFCLCLLEHLKWHSFEL